MNPNNTKIDYSRLLNRMYELAFSAYKDAERSRDDYLKDIHDLKILLARMETDECESDDDITPLKIKRREVREEKAEEEVKGKVKRNVKKVKRKGKRNRNKVEEVEEVEEEVEEVEEVEEEVEEVEESDEDVEESDEDEYDLEMLLTPEQRAKLLPKQSPETSPNLSPADHFLTSYSAYKSRYECSTYRTQEEKRYTRMCESFSTHRGCRHGDNCCFAHSIDQYKAIECRHAYDCKKVYTTSGRWYNCSSRPCTFLHPNESKREMLSRIGTVEPYLSPFELGETKSYAIAA